ncbi:hypothetical protein MKX01_036051 [Papaver californicum]|nr:hypothetical protein MKX01_036051 [Papaver californicum]
MKLMMRESADGDGSAATGYRGGVCNDSAVGSSLAHSSYSRNFTANNTKKQPSWLQNIHADLDEKMKTLSVTLTREEDIDSFANRAENYYRKRPQLLNLLQDLYNGYLSLADRYQHQITPIIIAHSDVEDEGDVIESDAESSVSIEIQNSSQSTDNLVAQLIMKTVDYEILVQEMGLLDRQCNESARKIELQKSLVEVLESERLLLLNENARLSYKRTNLMKATELARYVLKMREDHRVCMLSRKIEDLQGQLYGLEKRNKEYYENLVRREDDVKDKKREMALEVCFEKEANSTATTPSCVMKKKGAGKDGWWGKVNKFEMFCLCVPTDPKLLTVNDP